MVSFPHRGELAEFFGSIRIAPAGCWFWTAARSKNGYGRFLGDSAHRVSFLWFVGPIAAGLHIDHLCCHRACVNPAHLEAVTASENQRRRWRLEAQRGPVLGAMEEPPAHPGEIFDVEFVQPSGVSQAEVARLMGMSANRLNEIAKKKRPVTPASAVLMGAISGTDPRMWLHLQADRDLWTAMRELDVSKIQPLKKAG